MAYILEKSGKTVNEAISLALEELNVGREDVEVEIIEEGNKGIFGIGSRAAKVRVILKEKYIDKAKEFLTDVFEKMGILAEVEASEQEDAITINIRAEDSGIIIGRRGETLDALQYLTSLVVNKNSEVYKRVTLDIENYREKREETLLKLADRLAQKVIKNRRSITLEPMNPYERRIIHSALQGYKGVKTYSIGDEPNRKVVIALK
ncbi:MAG TPA: protein jag [Clostridiaceae bacterium]|nr:protein jag [Clostridiaceae bacterium]